MSKDKEPRAPRVNGEQPKVVTPKVAPTKFTTIYGEVLGDPWKSMHFRRIHARVAQRVWADILRNVPFDVPDADVTTVRRELSLEADANRHEIACDINHDSLRLARFEKKVMEDSLRLFADPNYYDNTKLGFRFYKP